MDEGLALLNALRGQCACAAQAEAQERNRVRELASQVHSAETMVATQGQALYTAQVKMNKWTSECEPIVACLPA